MDMGLALMNMINYNLSNGILHVYVTPPPLIQHTKTHQICTDHINGIAKLCYLIKDAQSDHYASKYFCVWLTHQWLLPIYTSHFCILLNISVKYLWQHAKSYFWGHDNTLYRKQGFLIQSGITKNGIHMTFKVVQVEGNENWSIGDQLRII